MIANYIGIDPKEGQTEKLHELLSRSIYDSLFAWTIDPTAQWVQYNCKVGDEAADTTIDSSDRRVRQVPGS